MFWWKYENQQKYWANRWKVKILTVFQWLYFKEFQSFSVSVIVCPSNHQISPYWELNSELSWIIRLFLFKVETDQFRVRIHLMPRCRNFHFFCDKRKTGVEKLGQHVCYTKKYNFMIRHYDSIIPTPSVTFVRNVSQLSQSDSTVMVLIHWLIAMFNGQI